MSKPTCETPPVMGADESVVKFMIRCQDADPAKVASQIETHFRGKPGAAITEKSNGKSGYNRDTVHTDDRAHALSPRTGYGGRSRRNNRRNNSPRGGRSRRNNRRNSRNNRRNSRNNRRNNRRNNSRNNRRNNRR